MYQGKTVMQKFKTICIGIAMMLPVSILSFSAIATEYALTGKIHILSTSDKELSGASEEEGFSSLRIDGSLPQSAGSCFVGSAGYVVIRVRENAAGERMFTTLLAAQLASETVLATIDDSYKTVGDGRGECYLNRIRIEK